MDTILAVAGSDFVTSCELDMIKKRFGATEWRAYADGAAKL